jgi:hypothetical protein
MNPKNSVSITNNVIYNQTFNNSQNVTNFNGKNSVYTGRLGGNENSVENQSDNEEQEEEVEEEA